MALSSGAPTPRLIAASATQKFECSGDMPEHFSLALETLRGIAELESLY
jgi:hypothetical protein